MLFVHLRSPIRSHRETRGTGTTFQSPSLPLPPSDREWYQLSCSQLPAAQNVTSPWPSAGAGPRVRLVNTFVFINTNLLVYTRLSGDPSCPSPVTWWPGFPTVQSSPDRTRLPKNAKQRLNGTGRVGWLVGWAYTIGTTMGISFPRCLPAVKGDRVACEELIAEI